MEWEELRRLSWLFLPLLKNYGRIHLQARRLRWGYDLTKRMIDQIRYLQSREPFATFAIELASGRIIQIHNRHSVSTEEGTHREAGVIGVLHQSGTFEVINASLIASVSVGLHPAVKEELDARMESVKKRHGGSEK